MPELKNKTKFWSMVSYEEADRAEITLYGDVISQKPRSFWTDEVLEGQYITPEDFAEDLARIRDKAEVVIKINSCGGDLYTGIAIHNALKGLSGHKTVIVEGIAASAASVIACAGDEVQVHPGSIIMIHCCASVFYDYMSAEDLKKALKGMEAADAAMAEIYHAKTNINVETLRSMMSKETWMTGRQAVEKGFADTLLGGSEEPDVQLSADKKMLLVAGLSHDVQGFHNIPKNIPILRNQAEPVAAENKSIKKEVTMTEQELREQYADIVASIEKSAADKARADATVAATKAERERLKAISSIEPMIADRELIEKAKYGENPMSASELALLAMQQGAKLQAAALKNIEADAANSGAAKVAGNPNGGNADDGSDDMQSFAKAVNAYKAYKGVKA